jgi:soluble lytic murein transglycosylase-like protein
VDPRTLGYNHPLLNAYATSVEQANKLPPGLLNAIKNYGERSGSLAVSPMGARGVMQFMPGTWGQYGRGDITDPYASIDAAGRYMKDLMQRYGGNVDAAITEYNGGAKQAKAVQGGGKPWVAETANYLSRVKAGMGGGDPQKVDITLTIPNAPAGTKATARTASGDVPVRINHSMNTLSAG